MKRPFEETELKFQGHSLVVLIGRGGSAAYGSRSGVYVHTFSRPHPLRMEDRQMVGRKSGRGKVTIVTRFSRAFDECEQQPDESK